MKTERGMTKLKYHIKNWRIMFLKRIIYNTTEKDLAFNIFIYIF
jgi:hypothetical protein